MADRTLTFSFSFSSSLAASPAEIWAHAIRMAGVNRELAPLVRMTHPPQLALLDPARIRPGERVFRSWILLFGVLPIDFDDLTFVEIEPGRRFLERSPMGTQRVWEHERTIDAIAGGARVVDRVRFEPRIAWLGRLQLPLFRTAFALRHRNLRRIFGALAGAPPRLRGT